VFGATALKGSVDGSFQARACRFISELAIMLRNFLYPCCPVQLWRFPVPSNENERWMQLCDLVAKENDPKRLNELVEEILRIRREQKPPQAEPNSVRKTG
jgi:hypothetical protein